MHGKMCRIFETFRDFERCGICSVVLVFLGERLCCKLAWNDGGRITKRRMLPLVSLINQRYDLVINCLRAQDLQRNAGIKHAIHQRSL